MPIEPHVHEWEPFAGWKDRHRCKICLCVGYSQSAQFRLKRDEVIKAYVCGMVKCSEVAIVRRDGKMLCRHHI